MGNVKTRAFRFFARPRLKTRKVLNYGILGTAAAAGAAGAMSWLSAPEGLKDETASTNARRAMTVGALATGAVLGRKHVVRAVAGGFAAGSRSIKKSGAVTFRRIRGRIVPIRVRG